jgi:hypothetical protein
MRVLQLSIEHQVTEGDAKLGVSVKLEHPRGHHLLAAAVKV